MQYLDYAVMAQLSEQAFQRQSPYPWVNIQHTLTDEGFDILRAALPDASLFDRNVGIKRAYGQAAHERALLHYLPNMDVPGPWKEFIAELHDEPYLDFAHRMFGVPQNRPLLLTLEWYYAWQSCSVSPHCDARRKVGTHLFYFNTQADWEPGWGGEVLILDDDGRRKCHSGPKIEELKVGAAVEAVGNASLLFKRTEHSWHAVRPLACPEGSWRRLFLVTINAPTLQVLWRRMRGKDPDGHRLPR